MLTIDSKNSSAWYYLGNIALKEGQYAAAIYRYDTAAMFMSVTHDDSDIEAWEIKTSLYINLSKAAYYEAMADIAAIETESYPERLAAIAKDSLALSLSYAEMSKNQLIAAQLPLVDPRKAKIAERLYEKDFLPHLQKIAYDPPSPRCEPWKPKAKVSSPRQGRIFTERSERKNL